MKSQIQKKMIIIIIKKNGGIVELPRFFQKKLLMRGQKHFLAKKIMGRLMPRFGRSFINDKCIFQ